MRPLTWEDTEDIALALFEEFPDKDPLSVRFTDLHKWITHLEGFRDDPHASTEGQLEAVQMAWLEQWQEAAGG
ncbi:MAG: Fe-S cluster assembly protein IscX [Bryobacteraceae bacterium]